MKVVYLQSISKPKTVNIYMQNIYFYYNFSVLYLMDKSLFNKASHI